MYPPPPLLLLPTTIKAQVSISSANAGHKEQKKKWKIPRNFLGEVLSLKPRSRFSIAAPEG